ncbi:hypothetical protein [Brotaphodocola sp.]|uniref:hypothetical protein n=1 Tax=Brotaphodocola sp. TaxID=3073577 RepID=UPI003D7C99D1
MERDSFFLKHKGKDCLFFALKFHIKFDMMELKPTLFFERGSFFMLGETDFCKVVMGNFDGNGNGKEE